MDRKKYLPILSGDSNNQAKRNVPKNKYPQVGDEEEGWVKLVKRMNKRIERSLKSKSHSLEKRLASMHNSCRGHTQKIEQQNSVVLRSAEGRYCSFCGL
mmetsp:Transcript_1304/g.1833  ORF Transcript_1304/g.1833 Transcript_1304/m.1833 type:complete len:99 (+) Transcript_1304:182-478(+)